jgi:1-deoxy-D-xylulose-5-phosphate reductoisomerase
LPRDFDGRFDHSGIRKLWLTASGGPFLRTARELLDDVTPQQACAHPKWIMGRKISVDSATLMNKGLEVIEASFLFNAKPAQIEVVIHPQSIVHSLVVDGSCWRNLAIPYAHADRSRAGLPDRIEAGVQSLNLCATPRSSSSRT